MRVAFLLSRFPELSQTFVLHQVLGLLDRGVDVHVFAAPPRTDTPLHAIPARYDLARRVHPPSRARWRQAALDPTFVRRLLSPRLALGAARLLADSERGAGRKRLELGLRFLREGHFDVVVCHFGTVAARALPLWTSEFCRIPLVTFFHGYDITEAIATRGVDYTELFRWGRLMLPISELWREKLIALGCPEQKIRVQRMGIDVDAFHPRSWADAPPAKPRFLGVGRLVEKKGFDVALHAFARVVQEVPGARLQIVGDGPCRQQLLDLAAALGLNDSVTFLGSLVQDEVRRLLRESDILVAPSRTSSTGDQEGIPVVLMEAMASGLPVVSTHHAGIPELVTSGVSGLLVEEGNSTALAEALISLARTPERWPVLGGEGRARVLADFNLSKLNDQLVGVLQEATDSRPFAPL
jgi:colanic acid/amylovoran biosynthesis glycosyltransferase